MKNLVTVEQFWHSAICPPSYGVTRDARQNRKSQTRSAAPALTQLTLRRNASNPSANPNKVIPDGSGTAAIAVPSQVLETPAPPWDGETGHTYDQKGWS